MNKLPRNTIIEFSPLDGMYLASGCYKFHIGIENVDKIKEIIREQVSSGKTTLAFPLKELELKFPQITEFYDKHIFELAGDSSKYFEYFGNVEIDGLIKENCSHNVKLYRDALKRAELPNLPEKHLLDFLETFEGCAVKVLDLKKNHMWGFGGVYENLPLDKNYFNMEFKNSRYALSHGSSSEGFIVIKNITEKEFELYKNWFLDVQKRKDNPFIPLKKKLEKILRDNFSHL